MKHQSHFECNFVSKLQQPDKSSARGKIIEYRVRVYSPDSGTEQVINVPGDVRTYSPTTCDKCEVTVWARNSKGLSPPASVRAPQITGKNNKTAGLGERKLSLERCFSKTWSQQSGEVCVQSFTPAVTHAHSLWLNRVLSGCDSNNRKTKCHHLLENARNGSSALLVRAGVVPWRSETGGAQMDQTEQGGQSCSHHRWDCVWSQFKVVKWYQVFTTVIVPAGVQPFVCYKGALYVFFNQSSASRTEFGGITAAESSKWSWNVTVAVLTRLSFVVLWCSS